MKILHVIPSVNPKGGGPIEGLRQYAALCPALGHRVEVLSLDAPDSAWLADCPLTVHAIGPSRGGYQYNPRLVPWLRAHVEGYDAVVINGIWQYHSFGAWRVLRKTKIPYFVFTHGMLDPWFKQTYPRKHLKKWLYWPWAEYRVLRDARAVLFTCEEERLLARKSFWLYKANEAVINYGSGSPPPSGQAVRDVFLAAYPALRDKRLLIFLGRIHEKKGCDLLIEAFAQVAGSDPSLHLVMAGPDQTGWVATLKQQAALLGLARRITWTGMLQGDIKWGALYASEAFVLTSHQENFGIAVAEALACGLPVLISDKVNIWREIEADGAGIVAADTVAGATSVLRDWLALNIQDRRRMAEQALSTFRRRFTIEAMAKSVLGTLERNCR